MLSTRKRVIMWGLGGAAAFLFLTASSCDSPKKNPGQDQAQDIANNRDNYIPKNDVEGHNYNAKQKLSDNPATLWWCTAMPTNPNLKAFTVPIAGKLTSASKRPYPTTQGYAGGGDFYYNPELPGSDGMFGTSADYRYGFDPAGNYHDFFNMEMHCTSVPDIIQKQATVIEIKNPDGNLAQLDAAVEVELAKCYKAVSADPKAYASGDGLVCPAAAQLLGITS